MSKKIVVINPAGFNGRGPSTLCVEYAKLGIDVLVKDRDLNGSVRPVIDHLTHLHLYTTIEDLLDFCKHYDRVLFLCTRVNEFSSDVLMAAKLLKKLYLDLEICYIYCARNIKGISATIPMCMKEGFRFDKIFSLCPITQSTLFDYCTSITLDINAFTFPKCDLVDVENRRNVVFTSGAVDGFKGTTRYLNSVDLNFLCKRGDYVYIHEGAQFQFHKDDNGVHCLPQLLSLFNLDKKPKQLKSQYAMRNYDECPEADKLTLYPSYDPNDIYDRWRYYYVGICCILGTIGGYCKSFDGLMIQDKRERTFIYTKMLDWNTSIEYADLEKIAAGVPVLFSREYAKLIGFVDERLIYNKYGDIPNIVNSLRNYYDEARIAQYDWAVRRQKSINEAIVRIFSE